MGPGSFDPGKCRHMSGRQKHKRLQWGRGLSTPEIEPTGATPFPIDAASMGPGSFDPGKATEPRQRTTGYRASMGPGSFDPGNHLRGTGSDGGTELQWGRGLSTPESHRALVFGFQRAGGAFPSGGLRGARGRAVRPPVGNATCCKHCISARASASAFFRAASPLATFIG